MVGILEEHGPKDGYVYLSPEKASQVLADAERRTFADVRQIKYNGRWLNLAQTDLMDGVDIWGDDRGPPVYGARVTWAAFFVINRLSGG